MALLRRMEASSVGCDDQLRPAVHTHAHWAYTFIYFGIGRRMFVFATTQGVQGDMPSGWLHFYF